jgi:hypothetical protein
MVNFSKSFLDFLEKERKKGSVVARLISNAVSHSGYYPAYNMLLTNKEVDYLTLRTDGTVSYLPAGKEHKTNDHGEWSREGRQNGKPAKIIRKLFTEKALRFIKAKEFEAFGNAYKAKFMDNGFTFEMRPAKAIPDVYCMIRADGGGSLNDSCMNGDRDYLEIYKKCPHLQILVLLNNEGHLCGRALVWNVENQEQGKMIFMDRIYSIEDYMFDMFLDYAKEQGWWTKREYKTFKDKNAWIHPVTGEGHKVNVKFNTPTDHDNYPYIDTFSYGGDNWLNNYGEGQYTYNETNGCREGDSSCEEDEHENESYDEINDCYIDCDDAVHLSSHGMSRYRNRTTTCNDAREVIVNRRGDTEWFHENDDNVVYASGSYYWVEHPEIVSLANGEYDLLDNCVICETDKEYYNQDDGDLLQAANGNYYHKDNDDDVIWVRKDNGGEFQYKPDVEDDIITTYCENYYWKGDPHVALVKGIWYVIESYSPGVIIKINNHWYLKDDCVLIGDSWYPVKSKLIKYVCATVDGNTFGHWYLKSDLVKYRNRYFNKHDDRIATIVKSGKKNKNTTTRKAHKTNA